MYRYIFRVHRDHRQFEEIPFSEPWKRGGSSSPRRWRSRRLTVRQRTRKILSLCFRLWSERAAPPAPKSAVGGATTTGAIRRAP